MRLSSVWSSHWFNSPLHNDAAKAGKSANASLGNFEAFCGNDTGMGKDRTYPVKVDVIRQLMEDKNISVSKLANATGLNRKSIHNILDKKSQPLEGNLVLIASALGVKWRSLVVGFESA